MINEDELITPERARYLLATVYEAKGKIMAFLSPPIVSSDTICVMAYILAVMASYEREAAGAFAEVFAYFSTVYPKILALQLEIEPSLAKENRIVVALPAVGPRDKVNPFLTKDAPKVTVN